MILLDTSVLIKHLRTADPSIRTVLSSNPIGVSVVTRAEILHGAKSDPNFASLTRMLDTFHQFGVDDAGWVDLSRNLYEIRKRGLTVPFPDALIATVAVRSGLELWTLDNHFRLMQAALPSLKLFTPAP